MTKVDGRAKAPKRIVAVASAGGHFNQLMSLRAGFQDHDVTYLTTMEGLADQFGATPARLVPDCNAKTPLAIVACALRIAGHLIRLRPHVVITTGALPGLLTIALGRLVGARTLWVDSIANAEELSASGRMARRLAHRTLSQWPAVAEATGTTYKGAIL